MVDSCPRCGTKLLFEELTLRMWCPGCSDYVENIRQEMCDGCEYFGTCKDDPQRLDYCPRPRHYAYVPRTCPSLEFRQGRSGLRVGKYFFNFLKKGEKPDAIISTPWNQAEVERNMREYPNLVVTKGKCDRCGCKIQLG